MNRMNIIVRKTQTQTPKNLIFKNFRDTLKEKVYNDPRIEEMIQWKISVDNDIIKKQLKLGITGYRKERKELEEKKNELMKERQDIIELFKNYITYRVSNIELDDASYNTESINEENELIKSLKYINEQERELNKYINYLIIQVDGKNIEEKMNEIIDKIIIRNKLKELYIEGTRYNKQ